MAPSDPSRGRRRSLFVVACSVVVVLGGAERALADWPQFQGDGSHAGVSDGPSAPLAVAWRKDVDVEQGDALGGLSAPVVADDGTVVTIGPHEVLGLSAEDGTERFRVDRDFGPSAPAAIAAGSDGPIVVYTEGYGDRPPGAGTATASPGASPSADAGEDDAVFDSHVNAVDLEGRPVWDEPAQLDAVVIMPVAVDDASAYVGDVDGGVTALDLATGEERWTIDLGSRISGPVTVDGDVLYVSTLGSPEDAGIVAALEAGTGEELWRTPTDEVTNPVSAPVLLDDTLVVLEPAAVVALDAADGTLRWRTDIVNPLRFVPFFYQGTATPTPLLAEELIVAVDVTGRVYGLDPASGSIRWDHALNGSSLLSLGVLADDQVIVPTDDGVVSAIELASGHLVWRVDAGAPLVRGLADAGEVVVAVTGFDDAGIVAFGPRDGTLLDEASPTTVDPAPLATGFALGGLLLSVAVVLLTRPLQRRFGPALAPDDLDGPEER